MKLCVFDDYRVGLVVDQSVVDVTELIADRVDPRDRMTELIERWTQLHDRVRAARSSENRTPLSAVTLRAPIPRPRVIVAAPVNYQKHQAEMGGEGGVYEGASIKTIETYAGFVKASSSIVGPDGAIEVPSADRRIDHEAELGVVIGGVTSRIPHDRALRHVFGYVPLLDITMRGEEDRSFRKSFDSFTPIGPWIVTADEISDPGALDMELRVNGEPRQRASTRDLIYGVPRLIELYSAAMTLRAGDLIATGTPSGVGPLIPGDQVSLKITGVGHLIMRVRARAVAA